MVWEQEEGQEKAGPEDEDGVGFKNVEAAPDVKKKRGPAKIGIGEGALNSAGGNITGVYERMISEKGCKAEPDCRSGGKGSEGKMRKFPAKREGLRKQ